MVIDILIEAIKKKKNPSVAGLDPRIDFLPASVKKEAFDLYGETPKGVGEAFYIFNRAIMDEIHDIVPAVKLQIAMYEQYGTEGISAYIRSIEYAKTLGLIVIGDIKRNDIASTAEAYSDGHIGRVEIGEGSFKIFDEDFITINPYLGSDSVEPFLKNCEKYEKGLFVLVKTSNPGSGEIQDLLLEDGSPLYTKVCGLVSKWGEDFVGRYGYSSVCAVVGATYPEQAKQLRKQFPHVFFLVPGYGSQGGTGADLAVCFDSDGLGAIVNNSRGIIAAYQKPIYKERFAEDEFAKAARQAAVDMREDLLASL